MRTHTARTHPTGRRGRREVDPITLDDGSELVVRSVGRQDETLLAGLVHSLSDESAYRRFLGPKSQLTRAELRYFTDLDHRDHDALLALDPRTGAAVAVARYIRDPRHPDAAELAVLVGDAWQARGLGTALSRRLAQRARSNGIGRFRALTLADNRPALKLIERLGSTRHVRDGHNVEIEVKIPAAPTHRTPRRAPWIRRAWSRLRRGARFTDS
jgi:RimJ/RimL family protein N-acetyltransferase